MLKDRLPDLLSLAHNNPNKFLEPEEHEDIPIPSELQQLLQRTEKILKFVNEMEVLLNDLKLQHQGVLTSSSVINTNQLREKITLISNRFTALARKTEAILRRIELSDQEKLRYSFCGTGTSIKSKKKVGITVQWKQTASSVKVTWPSTSTSTPVYIPAEIRMQMVLHDVLSSRSTNLVEKFYIEQKYYHDMSQKKIERQLSIIGKNIKQEDIDRIMDENVPLLHSEIHDDRHVNKQMRAQLKEVAHFEKEILQLERNINQLHNAFLMIAKLVHEQGVMVDRIEHHVMMAGDYIESSNQKLKKAGKLQNKYRKKKLILAIVIIVVLLIIAAIIAISVVTKRNNVTVRTPPPPHLRSRQG